MRHSTILAAIAGALICTAVQAGDVYKYTDERGNTMYTDRPMPGAIRIASGTQRPAEVTARNTAAHLHDILDAKFDMLGKLAMKRPRGLINRLNSVGELAAKKLRSLYDFEILDHGRFE